MVASRSVRVRISGRVQGVGFRAWAAGRARALGLAGTVFNRRDGAVEAVFSGSAEAVEAMLAACRDGPPHARVERVEVIGEAKRASGAFTIEADR
jgi:acylphosphatase